MRGVGYALSNNGTRIQEADFVIVSGNSEFERIAGAPPNRQFAGRFHNNVEVLAAFGNFVFGNVNLKLHGLTALRERIRIKRGARISDQGQRRYACGANRAVCGLNGEHDLNALWRQVGSGACHRRQACGIAAFGGHHVGYSDNRQELDYIFVGRNRKSEIRSDAPLPSQCARRIHIHCDDEGLFKLAVIVIGNRDRDIHGRRCPRESVRCGCQVRGVGTGREIDRDAPVRQVRGRRRCRGYAGGSALVGRGIGRSRNLHESDALGDIIVNG